MLSLIHIYPLLDAVAALIKNSKVWTGSATELSALLTGIEIEANVLTRALNIAVDDLLEDYKIRYSNKHTSKGSPVSYTHLDVYKRQYVPLAEMFGYSTDLRSRTQGRGNYSMFFEKYEQVPKSVQEKVLSNKNA